MKNGRHTYQYRYAMYGRCHCVYLPCNSKFWQFTLSHRWCQLTHSWLGRVPAGNDQSPVALTASCSNTLHGRHTSPIGSNGVYITSYRRQPVPPHSHIPLSRWYENPGMAGYCFHDLATTLLHKFSTRTTLRLPTNSWPLHVLCRAAWICKSY